MWLKISSVQTFYFFSSNVTTFPTSRKCKDVNFSLHTVPAEMLYLQKYLKNFQKQSFGWKMMKGGYCGWKVQEHRHFAFAIATLSLFQHPENLVISIFPYTLSEQKCYIFKSISRTFKNVLFPEIWGRWLLWLKNFKCTDILVMQ